MNLTEALRASKQIKKQIKEQRWIRRNQPAVSCEDARKQFLRVELGSQT